jgi:hypothetical protein
VTATKTRWQKFLRSPNEDFGSVSLALEGRTNLSECRSGQVLVELYASQTKILEGGTKDEMRICEALFNGSWPKLTTHALENLRLGSVSEVI